MKIKNGKKKEGEEFQEREKKNKQLNQKKTREKRKQVRKKQNSYLRCEVLWRATEGLHGSSVCDALLAEAKICDLDMAIFIQHQVFQLEETQNTQQVPICNFHHRNLRISGSGDCDPDNAFLRVT